MELLNNNSIKREIQIPKHFFKLHQHKKSMTPPIKYTCSCCGKELEEWPALTYQSPMNYDTLSKEEKENIATLTTDFCTITYPDQTDRFIRCILIQKVKDSCQQVEYGIWVSLSEKNYTDYSQNFNNQHHQTTYFGWLCNDIPGYQFKESIPTTVHTSTGNQRPEIIPHQDYNHPFVKDYHNGITIAEAERRITEMINAIQTRDQKLQPTKPWWKIW